MKCLSMALLIVFLLGCKPVPPTPNELYSTYRKSVVLIHNSYYFKTTLSNGLEFFYTLEDGIPVFHDTEEEAKSNANEGFGTGFFISNRGEIATNRHVIYPPIDEDKIGTNIVNRINDTKYKIQVVINDTKGEMVDIASYYNEYNSFMSLEKRISLRESFTEKQNQILGLESLLEEFDFDKSKTKNELKIVFLGVAYDDTHVTSIGDFDECVPLKKSHNSDVDLAVIQLKNKTTPSHVPKTFDINNIQSNTLSLNDPVYMIGYNHGFALAKTDDGIKSQFTQGTITQEPDQTRILYSIPTLPGSSGSPIIDKWGNLVAINFAKTKDYQGFSFGIPAILLANMYLNPNELNRTSSHTSNNNGRIPEKNEVSNDNHTQEDNKIDFKSLIIKFLRAEERRDFEDIYSYFSTNINRYYDIYNPNYTSLKSRYEYVWGFTSNSRNEIKSIRKINEYTYDLHTKFSYYHTKKGTVFTVESTVRFLFDSDGKILELYSTS